MNSVGGGLAFLIPYLISVIIIGIPLMCAELAVGQFSSSGPMEQWNLCPIWYGTGLGCAFMVLQIVIDFNTICCYLLFYTALSFQHPLPWTECDPSWAGINCYTFKTNHTAHHHCVEEYGKEYCDKQNWQNSAEHFFSRRLLNRDDTVIFGAWQWKLICISAANQFVIFLCLRCGTRLLQKLLCLLCVLPNSLHIFLLFISFFHEGAVRGLHQFLIPRFSALLNIETWYIAFELAVTTGGLGMGLLFVLGSMSNFRSPVHMEAIVFILIDLGASLIFGAVTYMAVGTIAFELNTSTAKVSNWEGETIFIHIPFAIQYWKGIPQIWSIILFASIYISAMRCIFFMYITLLYAITETIPKMQNHSQKCMFFVCCAVFILGIPYFSQSGISILYFVENALNNINIILVFLEVIGIMWIYGTSNFVNDLHFMLGFRPSTFWIFCWYCSPLLIIGYFCLTLYRFYIQKLGGESTPLQYVLKQILVYSPLIIHVLYVILYIIRAKDKRITKLFKPSPQWGPVDPILRKSRDMFSAHSMTKEYMYRQNRLKSKKFQTTAITMETLLSRARSSSL